jgi:hypothetical protein
VSRAAAAARACRITQRTVGLQRPQQQWQQRGAAARSGGALLRAWRASRRRREGFVACSGVTSCSVCSQAPDFRADYTHIQGGWAGAPPAGTRALCQYIHSKRSVTGACTPSLRGTRIAERVRAGAPKGIKAVWGEAGAWGGAARAGVLCPRGPHAHARPSSRDSNSAQRSALAPPSSAAAQRSASPRVVSPAVSSLTTPKRSEKVRWGSRALQSMWSSRVWAMKHALCLGEGGQGGRATCNPPPHTHTQPGLCVEGGARLTVQGERTPRRQAVPRPPAHAAGAGSWARPGLWLAGARSPLAARRCAQASAPATAPPARRVVVAGVLSAVATSGCDMLGLPLSWLQTWACQLQAGPQPRRRRRRCRCTGCHRPQARCTPSRRCLGGGAVLAPPAPPHWRSRAPRPCAVGMVGTHRQGCCRLHRHGGSGRGRRPAPFARTARRRPAPTRELGHLQRPRPRLQLVAAGYSPRACRQLSY